MANPAGYRRIDGKVYRLAFSGQKHNARDRAKGYRKQGSLARIIFSDGEWCVYTKRR